MSGPVQGTHGAVQRFEGSYMGAAAKISRDAVLECKICWTPYDPAEGDETRQIPPGTPFLALPHDWKCPTCDAPKEQFMVLSDPGRDTGMGGDATQAPQSGPMQSAVAVLEAEFREIHNAKMRDVPFSNKALSVEAVGFRPWRGHYLGVLVAPWFMNLTLLPGPGEDWTGLESGAKELIDFPSGTYEFIHTVRPVLGGYKGCSLFSPMAEFASQLQATDVARAVMQALFDEANREQTDRTATIRARREAEFAAMAGADAEEARPAADPTPSRRQVITGGLTSKEAEETG